jgi:DNA-binding MarR family transcriptional regulator
MQTLPTAAPGLGFVLEFLREVWALDHGLQTLSKRMMAQFGVTGPQRLVIRVIGKFPGASPGDLAGILCLHPSTLSGVLRRLEESGTVRREPHPWDKRKAQLHLTAKGRKLNRIERGTVEAAVERLLGKLTAARINNACSLMRLLTAELAEQLSAPGRHSGPPPRSVFPMQPIASGTPHRHARA